MNSIKANGSNMNVPTMLAMLSLNHKMENTTNNMEKIKLRFVSNILFKIGSPMEGILWGA
jgi:hypothetical protein